MALSRRVLSQMRAASWLGAASLLALPASSAPPARDPLPFALLGTLASTDPALSHATLLDRERDERLVVGIGDRIRDRAIVMWIERDRVFLRESGVDHELARGGARRASNPTHDDFARLNAEFHGVHVFPVYETDRMIGLEFGLIQYGTRFAEIGLQTGDVITELDGRPVDSAAMSEQVLAVLSESGAFFAVGRGADGSARAWSPPSNH